ncbi:hypothetical protein ACWEDF_11215 [Micromonospora chersina]
MNWEINPGDVLPRRSVHDHYGGSRQSGMTRAAGTHSLLLFSSKSGLRYGYDFDGWRSDGAFHYTGEGQVGDQLFTRNNEALRDHVARGLRPRLFEEARRSVVRYVGEFRVAEDQGHYPEEARDRLLDLRKVIVFRLFPVEAEVPAAPSVGFHATSVLVRDVPIEAHAAETFQSEPKREPTFAERREAALVQRYTTWLAKAGTVATRKEVRLPELGRPLYTDLFDPSRLELLEAKSSASRNHVRLAIGQLFDYARHVEHTSLAVLLPSDPGSDLLQLLHSVSVVCIHETEHGEFVRLEPPGPV